jgi:CHAT domain-containing protein
MPAALEEAELVAGRFGISPLPEERATGGALRDALTTARFVHVSAHGMHDVAAPAFQCVFMAPGDGRDGRVFAHEVLDLDLRGLELLTLGACETALGRFDAADNLRGLPAAFLLRGVRRIVGTLWPVHPEASKLFFSELYGAIADEADILDAFPRSAGQNPLAVPALQQLGRLLPDCRRQRPTSGG